MEIVSIYGRGIEGGAWTELLVWVTAIVKKDEGKTQVEEL
jgi:hypothetical protein